MRYVFLFAHADDETLSAGGWIAKLRQANQSVAVVVMSDGLVTARGKLENNGQCLASACATLGVEEFYLLDAPDQKFESLSRVELVEKVAALNLQPDWLITHNCQDLNNDHRLTAEVAKILARPRDKKITLVAAESPLNAPFNAAAFAPNFYVDIAQTISQKQAAFACYLNEQRPFPSPCSSEGIETLAKFRGMEAGMRYAEAYQILRHFA